MSEWMFWLQIPLIQLNLPFWGGPTAIHEKMDDSLRLGSFWGVKKEMEALLLC